MNFNQGRSAIADQKLITSAIELHTISSPPINSPQRMLRSSMNAASQSVQERLGGGGVAGVAGAVLRACASRSSKCATRSATGAVDIDGAERGAMGGGCCSVGGAWRAAGACSIRGGSTTSATIGCSNSGAAARHARTRRSAACVRWRWRARDCRTLQRRAPRVVATLRVDARGHRAPLEGSGEPH